MREAVDNRGYSDGGWNVMRGAVDNRGYSDGG